MSSSSSSKKIVLKSSEGETFEIDEKVALESQTIKNMIEDECADTAIPLPFQQVGAPARVGLVAPVDVVVPPGITGLDPSHTSFFQVLATAPHMLINDYKDVLSISADKVNEYVADLGKFAAAALAAAAASLGGAASAAAA